MSNPIKISIIVPFYNAEKHINNCLDALLKQSFNESYEIIMVNDASTDNSINEIKKNNSQIIKIFSLIKNTGQSAARNLGIRNASGEYIFFMDVDDTIEIDTLSTLYDVAVKNDCDVVFSDFKRIEASVNQRSNIFNYENDQFFNHQDLLNVMINELYNHNPLFGHLGIFGCNARLIKSSIIHDNKIFFCDELRYLEDKTFGWDILGFAKKVYYLKKQLYSYNVFPNVSTAIIDGVNNGFPLSNFKLVKKHIEQSLRNKGLSENEVHKALETKVLVKTRFLNVVIKDLFFL